MTISGALAPDAIRNLFAASSSNARGPMEAGLLYRQWPATGLRHEDLGAGLVSMWASGELSSAFRQGNCMLALSRKSVHENKAQISGPEYMMHRQGLIQAVSRQHLTMHHGHHNRRALDRVRSLTPETRRMGRSGRLLATLPQAYFASLVRLMELVPMTKGDVLWEHGDRIRHVYFPIDCLLSNLLQMEDGFCSEVAIIGNEGAVGISLCSGVDQSGFRTVVTRSGFAHRLPAAVLLEEFSSAGALQTLLLRYSQALLMQVSYGAACKQHHSIGSQLARLLLSAADRMRSLTLLITHDKMAEALGVRRETVTVALQRLTQLGLISCQRGQVTVLDRKKLENNACECYSLIRRDFDSMRGLFQALH